jgi:hypothetical protein
MELENQARVAEAVEAQQQASRVQGAFKNLLSGISRFTT